MSQLDELELLNKEYATNSSNAFGILDSIKLGKVKTVFNSNFLFQGRVIRILNSIVQNLQYFRSKSDSELDLKIGAAVTISEKKQLLRTEELFSRMQKLEDLLSSAGNKIETLDSVTKGLESIVGLIGSSERSAKETSQSKNLDSPDFNYLILENRFRGSEENIRSKLSPYADLVGSYHISQGSSNKVLEVGCGRGEFLELLQGQNIPCLGVEMDTGMYALAKDKKLEVTLDDIVSYLKTSANDSILGLTAFQVVEHMKYPYLLEFLSESFAKIQKGGFILLETINTSSLIPLMQNYFRDPTHTAPLHPDTLCFLIEQAGFKVKQIHKSSHYPKEAIIQDIPAVPELPFRYQELSRQLNSRIEVLNRLLFDSQDYAVEAIKP